MSYQSQIEKDRPIVYKTFDDATNKTHPLVAGLGNAALVTTSAFTHTFNQWTQGPFTLEVWFKPLSNNTITVLGHDDDGIVYDPETKMLTFTAKQTDGTFVSTSQSADDKVMYVVAQYTGYSINLMVNGSATTAFTTLPLQTTGSLRTGAGKMSVDALAMYNYVLSDYQMQMHYYLGRDFPFIDSVYANAENYFSLTDDREEVLASLTFPDWAGAYADGVTVNTDGYLVNDIGVPDGHWYVSVMLDDDVILYGSKLVYEYDGTEPLVEVSLDGENWTRAYNNQMLPMIPVNDNLPDTDPIIKFTLSNESVLKYVYVVVYGSDKNVGSKTTSTIAIDRPATSASEVMYPFEQDDSGGANLANGGLSLVVESDEDIVAVSYWYKGDEPTGGNKNGGLGHLADQWNFYYDAGTALPSAYNGRVANVATWSNTQDPAALYARHFAKPTIRVSETDKIKLNDASNGVKVYQNNWTML